MLTSTQLDSAFQLQEHLKALHYKYSKDSESDSAIPIIRETAILIATQPAGVDRALWLYELCRFLINKCNDLIIGFLFDTPPCSAATCPEMRASEWQFLCAVHDSPKSCCAIDYCCHTLDWASNIVTSQKLFPSRLSLGAGDSGEERGNGVKHLTNIFRRLHRIFAHAWFQHRDVFWDVENNKGIYVLFKTVCDTYDLLPAENYKLPPEAEGLKAIEESSIPDFSSSKNTGSIFKLPGSLANSNNNDEDFMGVGRTNTRRHIRQSPSVGSAIPTVLESDEEETPAMGIAQRLRNMQIMEEEGESDIPVIVETYEVDENHDEDEKKSEPETINHGTIHVQGDSVTHSSAEDVSPDPKEQVELEKDEEETTSIEADENTKPDHPLDIHPDSVNIDPEDELQELERFSPEILKEEPRPDTEDIPTVTIDSAEEENGEKVKESG